MTEPTEEAAASEKQLTFNVKSSNDGKYVLTVPESMTVLELKTKLSTSDYADLPAERQRLIYSGRVLKDAETVGSYNIKDGNTVHLVRGAASNLRQNPSSSSAAPGTPVPGAGVPQNIATGPGTDPLAGLTGARYAGFAQMPGAGLFGPDGGMGGQDPSEMLEMLDNPMFLSQMNEAMNSPMFQQMIMNSPGLRDQPMMREMLNNPEMRRQLLSPQMLRMALQMRQQGIGAGMGGGSSFPAPGVTDTTPQEDGATNAAGASPNPTPNLFPFGIADGQGNPFAALFGPQAGGTNPTASNMPSSPSSTLNSNTNTSSTNTQDPSQSPNPFGSLFGAPPTQSGQQGNPLAQMTQQLMQDPQALQRAMESMRALGMMGGGTGGANPQDTTGNPAAATAQQVRQNLMLQAMETMRTQGFGGGDTTGNPVAAMAQQVMQNAMQQAMDNLRTQGMTGGAAGNNLLQGAANPFENLFVPGGLSGFGGSPSSPPPPPDNRPPEEVYSEQLRQLNDMGFYDFEQNVRALRRSGGSVQGAVEALLSGT